MCAPRWDSPSVFGTLLGGRRRLQRHAGRTLRVGRPLRGHLDDLAQPLGHHDRGHRVPRGAGVSGRPGPRGAVAPPPRGRRPGGGRPSRCDPRADYDQRPITDLRLSGSWRIPCRRPAWALERRAGARRSHADEALTLAVRLAAGEQHDLVLELAAGRCPTTGRIPMSCGGAPRRPGPTAYQISGTRWRRATPGAAWPSCAA